LIQNFLTLQSIFISNFFIWVRIKIILEITKRKKDQNLIEREEATKEYIDKNLVESSGEASKKFMQEQIIKKKLKPTY